MPRFLQRKDPLEESLLEVVRGQMEKLLTGGRESILRGYIEEELATRGENPRAEGDRLQGRIAEIDRLASVLLDGISAENHAFVDSKLRDLTAEKRGLVGRLEALAAVSSEVLDPEVILQQGRAALRDLARVMAFGSLEERKEFIRAFVTGVTVHRDKRCLEVRVRKIPASALPKPGSSVELVAGASLRLQSTDCVACT